MTADLSEQISDAFNRHERVALQFSGGKDSLALLYLLRPWWDRLCVYWLNTGDTYPETLDRMSRIRNEVPLFVEVAGRQPEIIAADGWPSDVVPQRHTSDSNTIFGPTAFRVQSRLSCCIRALMFPMHQAMKADGVTLLIRGKRADEADKTGLVSGHIEGGIELLFPLMGWSEEDVFAYLADEGIPLPPFYEYATSSLDCMSCTAWLEHKNGAYLAAKHPEKFIEHTRRMGLIRDAVNEQMRGM